MRNKKSLRLLISLLLLGILAFSGTAGFAQESSVQASVATDLLNVRQTPSTGVAVVNQLALGAVVTVSGREDIPNNGGSWVYVTPSDGSASGWVLARYLDFPGEYNIGVLPVVSAQGGTSTNAPASIVSGSLPAGIQGTTGDLANFRTGPELTYEIIRTLQPNTPLILLGQNESGVWINAAVGSETGWLFFTLVKSSVSLNTLPVVGAEGASVPANVIVPQPAPSASQNTDTTTTTTGQSSSGASSSSPNIGFGVKPGTEGGWDGRLNAYADLGYALVYCIDGNRYSNTYSYAGGGIVVRGTPIWRAVFEAFPPFSSSRASAFARSLSV